MSNRNPRERFDYKSWFERNVAKRTVAALAARDAEFAEKHADTPLAHLAQYVGNRAELLRHTPSPCEIDGGTFIEQRFGSWDNAMTAAGLPRPKTTPKLNNTLRYRMEKEKLLPLFLAERKEKKRQKQIEKNLRQGQLAHEKAVKRRAEREAAEAEKTAAEKDTNPCQAETV